MTTSTAMDRMATVRIGGKDYPYLRRWSGGALLPEEGPVEQGPNGRVGRRGRWCS